VSGKGSAIIIIIIRRLDPLLGNDSVNTSRGNEHITIEDIRCYAMDVFSVSSDSKLYNEKPTITDSF
jgi:hypothetical protein